MVTLKRFSGLGAANVAKAHRDRLSAEAGEGGEVIDSRTVRAGNGRVLGWRQGGGDTFEVVEFTEIEGLELRLAFCEGQAANYAERAAGWPQGHQLHAYNLRDEATWRAKADAVRVAIEARKGVAA